MGCMPRLFSDGDPTPPNPNPHRFEILAVKEIGPLTVARIHYEGCTTYEGNKVAVFRMTAKDLKARNTLDPHFNEDPASPIARFPGDQNGFETAVEFAKGMLAKL